MYQWVGIFKLHVWYINGSYSIYKPMQLLYCQDKFFYNYSVILHDKMQNWPMCVYFIYGNAGHPSVRPRYVVSALRFLFVDQLILNLHTSIILGISSLSLKSDKIRKKLWHSHHFFRWPFFSVAIFKMSVKRHQNFKVLQFQRKLIFRRFSTWGMW
jgi:hypothetical protein